MYIYIYTRGQARLSLTSGSNKATTSSDIIKNEIVKLSWKIFSCSIATLETRYPANEIISTDSHPNVPYFPIFDHTRDFRFEKKKERDPCKHTLNKHSCSQRIPFAWNWNQISTKRGREAEGKRKFLFIVKISAGSLSLTLCTSDFRTTDNRVKIRACTRVECVRSHGRIKDPQP